MANNWLESLQFWIFNIQVTKGTYCSKKNCFLSIEIVKTSKTEHQMAFDGHLVEFKFAFFKVTPKIREEDFFPSFL